MTDDDLSAIEHSLHVTLPTEYRAVMAGGDARSETDFWYGGLYNHPQRVIRDTLELRAILRSYNQACPDSWVVVSEINGGDLAFIDTAEASAPLRYWDHETMKVDSHTDTVTSFVGTVRQIKRSDS